jgi:hypothetical protein
MNLHLITDLSCPANENDLSGKPLWFALFGDRENRS